MIQESPKEVIDCVGECCINLIKCNVRVTNGQKNQLRARKQHIRLLSAKQVPLDTKKKIINQKGGALLGLLLKPLIAPIIGSVFGEIIKKIKYGWSYKWLLCHLTLGRQETLEGGTNSKT